MGASLGDSVVAMIGRELDEHVSTRAANQRRRVVSSELSELWRVRVAPVIYSHVVVLVLEIELHEEKRNGLTFRGLNVLSALEIIPVSARRRRKVRSQGCSRVRLSWGWEPVAPDRAARSLRIEVRSHRGRSSREEERGRCPYRAICSSSRLRVEPY